MKEVRVPELRCLVTWMALSHRRVLFTEGVEGDASLFPRQQSHEK